MTIDKKVSDLLEYYQEKSDEILCDITDQIHTSYSKLSTEKLRKLYKLRKKIEKLGETLYELEQWT